MLFNELHWFAGVLIMPRRMYMRHWMELCEIYSLSTWICILYVYQVNLKFKLHYGYWSNHWVILYVKSLDWYLSTGFWNQTKDEATVWDVWNKISGTQLLLLFLFLFIHCCSEHFYFLLLSGLIYYWRSTGLSTWRRGQLDLSLRI